MEHQNILSKWRVHNEHATKKMYLINIEEHLELCLRDMFNNIVKLNARFILLLKYIKFFIKRLIFRVN